MFRINTHTVEYRYTICGVSISWIPRVLPTHLFSSLMSYWAQSSLTSIICASASTMLLHSNKPSTIHEKSWTPYPNFKWVFAISGDRMVNTGHINSELNGMLFSTLDRDNDRYNGDCATKYSGGWWFNNCHDAYLNGPWAPENWHDPWYPTITDGSNIVEVRLMIKPA